MDGIWGLTHLPLRYCHSCRSLNITVCTYLLLDWNPSWLMKNECTRIVVTELLSIALSERRNFVNMLAASVISCSTVQGIVIIFITWGHESDGLTHGVCITLWYLSHFYSRTWAKKVRRREWSDFAFCLKGIVKDKDRKSVTRRECNHTHESKKCIPDVQLLFWARKTHRTKIREKKKNEIRGLLINYFKFEQEMQF